MENPTQRHAEKNIVSRLEKRIIITIAILVISTFIGGCGKKRIPPPQITFTIKSNEETNQGRLFYVAIRSVNSNQFLIETYQGAASMIYTDPPDPSILARRVILPGEKQKIKVVKPDQNQVGLYFFFTDPGDPWRVMIEQPLDDKYKIALDKNRIVQTEKSLKKKKGFFRKLWPF